MTVIEVTGGSTGTSLAMVCAQKGLKFKAFTSDAFAEEKLKNIKAFGGLLDLTISDKGKVSRDLFPIMMQKCKMMCKEDNQIYYADQFNNRDALPGYENIGLELITQFPDGIDKFCGTVGTAGMLKGVSTILKKKWPSIKIILIEPSSSPVISQGQERVGTHTIDGISLSE